MPIDPEQKALWLYELSLNGFLLLPRFLPADLIQAMHEQFRPIYEAEVERARRGDVTNLRGRNRLSVDLAPYIRHLGGPLDDDRFRRNPIVEELAGAVLGRWRHGVTKAECPFEDSCLMAWHPDLSLEETGDPDGPPRSTRLTFNVALTDVNDANGPMEVIPGSHRMHHHQTARLLPLLPEIHPVKILMRRGDCLLRNGNLLHRGTTNLSGRPRILLDQTYRALD
jgi:hypothetical protein